MSIIFVNGRRVNRENTNRPPKSKTIATLLSMFGGAFGLHKLYLEDIGGFILYMVLFLIFSLSMPVTIFLGIMNAFQLFNMSQQEFDQKYNGGYVKRGDPRIEKRREEQMKRYESEDKERPYFEAPQQRQRANPFKSSGIAKYKDFDLDGAIEDFLKGLDIDPNDVSLNFNIACAYSLSEKKDEAFKHLAKAVSLGFNNFERILTHDDLAFVRIQPEFYSFKQSGYRIYVGSRPVPKSQTTTSTQTTTVIQPQEVDENLLAQLNRLAELRDRGILSEQEFLLEKKKLTRN